MLYTVPGVPRFGTIKTGEPHGSSPGNILANQIRTLVPPVSQRSNFSAEGTYSIAVSNSFARFSDRTYSAEITHRSYRRMTTSRIYAYRWPARLVSHKPFAAESYSITPSYIWQVFFGKKNEFSFLFSLFCEIAFFLCKMHNPIPFYGWKTPLPRCRNGSMAVFGVFMPIYKENPPSAIVPRCQKEGFLTFSSAVRPDRPAG